MQNTLTIMGGTRCVVWPNIVRPPVGGRSYAGYNRVLADAARSHRNFRLVDWARMVSRNRHWLAGDGVHVSAEGYQARAWASRLAVRALLVGGREGWPALAGAASASCLAQSSRPCCGAPATATQPSFPRA